MRTQIQALQAGVTQPLNMRGRTFLIQAADQGASLTVDVLKSGAIIDTIMLAGPGMKITPVGGFDGIQLTAPTAGNVTYIVTDGEIDLQLQQLNTQITNGTGNPVPVNVQGGNITVTATNVGINNTSANPVPVSLVSEPGAPVPVSGTVALSGTSAVSGTVNIGNAVGSPVPVSLVSSSDATAIPVQAQPPATTPADSAPVAVATAGGVLLAASATRKAFRVMNAGAGKLALTAASGTAFANAAVVLNPGDMWNETDAPGAAWYAVSDSGTTANIQVLS